MWVHRLPLVDVGDLFYDAQQRQGAGEFAGQSILFTPIDN